MDNKAIANILYETADLLEIDGQDSFRIRSYRNAAQAIESHAHQIKDIIGDPKQVLAIAGVGKGMLTDLQELFNTGKLAVQSRTAREISPFHAATPEPISGLLSTKPAMRILYCLILRYHSQATMPFLPNSRWNY